MNEQEMAELDDAVWNEMKQPSLIRDLADRLLVIFIKTLVGGVMLLLVLLAFSIPYAVFGDPVTYPLTVIAVLVVGLMYIIGELILG